MSNKKLMDQNVTKKNSTGGQGLEWEWVLLQQLTALAVPPEKVAFQAEESPKL